MSEGLVDPVWSDSGDVTVGEVTEFEPISLEFVQIIAAMEAWNAKQGDSNAKPALPALTQVGGNKRGPGWCDE